MQSVFLAAATRSGSTHIANSLVRCGLRRASVHGIVNGAYNEEHCIDPQAAACLFPLSGFVYQSHVRAMGRTRELLDSYKVPTVVTCRNLFDSLLSFKENTELDYLTNPVHFRKTTHIGVLLPPWGDMNESQKWGWVVDNMTPWYISFYVSWKDCGFPTHWVWYEDYFRNQEQGLTKILEWAGIPQDRQTASAWCPTDGKLSVGRVGRGLQQMPEWAKIRVMRHTEEWGSWYEDITRDLCKNA
jgi:hypothetical protein